MACTTPNIIPLAHPCTPQMGGIKYVYLAVGGSLGNRDEPSVILFQTADTSIFLSGAYDPLPDRMALWGLAVSKDGHGTPLYGEGAYTYIDEDLALTYGDLPVYRIALTRQQAVITSEASVNRDNNTVVYANSVVIPTLGLTPEAVALVKGLAQGGVAVIGETYDGRLIAFGFEERATLSAASLTSGAAFGDNPGATITLVAEESTPIFADAAWLDEVGGYSHPKDKWLLKILTDFGHIA